MTKKDLVRALVEVYFETERGFSRPYIDGYDKAVYRLVSKLGLEKAFEKATEPSADEDFMNSNFILFARLSRMGYPPEEQMALAKKIASGEIEMDSVRPKGETKNGK